MTRARSLSKLSNPATFTVDTDNNVGVNSVSPVEKLNIVGVVSATSFFGDGSSLTGVSASGLSGTPDVTVNDITARNITGVAATFTGVVTYEDVTNVDSVGVVTAQSGLNVIGGGATVTGVSTFFDTVRVGSAITLGASSGIITATKFVGSGEGLTGVASTDNIITSVASTFASINSTGIVTAVSFSGDGSGFAGVGGDTDITSSLFI